MSAAGGSPAHSTRTAASATPVADLVLVLVVLGLAGIVTAGGIVGLAARIQASATGYEVDGISLLLPGLGVTAVVTFLAAATTARMVRGARRITADALARHAAGRAIVPFVVTAALVLVLCEYRAPGGLAEVAGRRPELAVLTCALYATAALALAVAARGIRRATRVRALGVAGAALVGGAVAMPYLATVSLQSGALVVCAALLLRRSRDAGRGGSGQLSGRVPSGSAPPA